MFSRGNSHFGSMSADKRDDDIGEDGEGGRSGGWWRVSVV